MEVFFFSNHRPIGRGEVEGFEGFEGDTLTHIDADPNTNKMWINIVHLMHPRE